MQQLHPVAGLQMVFTWHARMILKDLEQLSSWFQNRYEMKLSFFPFSGRPNLIMDSWTPNFHRTSCRVEASVAFVGQLDCLVEAVSACLLLFFNTLL